MGLGDCRIRRQADQGEEKGHERSFGPHTAFRLQNEYQCIRVIVLNREQAHGQTVLWGKSQ